MDRNVYCLGFFDAIHRGHRRLLAKGKELASVEGGKLITVTFDDGIYASLGKDIKEIYLLRERKEIITSLNSEIKILPSDKKFLSISAKDFLEFLANFNPFAIVCGTDYTFGQNAVGNATMLSQYFSERGVHVEIMDLVENNGKKISTTNIRELLAYGKIQEANKLLESPFFISGTVVKGRQSGRKIGIPTANIDFEKNKFAPRKGVYATKTIICGKPFFSVTNIGNHPTFGDEHVNVETHIIGFDDNIYGTEIKVEFYEYLRDIIAFENIDALIKQIKYDINTTIRSFKND